jgi:hypothetical protein
MIFGKFCIGEDLGPEVMGMDANSITWIRGMKTA